MLGAWGAAAAPSSSSMLPEDNLDWLEELLTSSEPPVFDLDQELSPFAVGQALSAASTANLPGPGVPPASQTSTQRTSHPADFRLQMSNSCPVSSICIPAAAQQYVDSQATGFLQQLATAPPAWWTEGLQRDISLASLQQQRQQQQQQQQQAHYPPLPPPPQQQQQGLPADSWWHSDNAHPLRNTISPAPPQQSACSGSTHRTTAGGSSMTSWEPARTVPEALAVEALFNRSTVTALAASAAEAASRLQRMEKRIRSTEPSSASSSVQRDTPLAPPAHIALIQDLGWRHRGRPRKNSAPSHTAQHSPLASQHSASRLAILSRACPQSTGNQTSSPAASVSASTAAMTVGYPAYALSPRSG